MDRASAFDKIDAHAATFTGLVADLTARLVAHLRRLTVEIDELATAITSRITPLAPSLLAIPGCAALTAAKIIGETGWHRPVSFPGRLRPAQRHRTAAGAVVQPGSTSSLAHREPTTQRRAAPHRAHPGPVSR
ncbi:transposase [Rhodococcus ruber BKS 20-38]|uniref:Transposase n=1 Tax=Rhodococcus ruber BKS 20-38 TaxID=1278076 RepID=M2YYV4_9NOCA|nr:transposase [Rhodococcus ruber BKS 20-38]